MLTKLYSILTFTVTYLKVVTDAAERYHILKMCHEGGDSSIAVTALGGHTGRDKTLWKIRER